jgi:3-oxoacyl-[acyl-carrier protein] reductase
MTQASNADLKVCASRTVLDQRATLIRNRLIKLARETALVKPVAIVTGASRGIGRAIAVELARTHSVIATYKERREAAESLREETGVEILRCDVSLRSDREALIASACDRFGRLDLLVNNAGIAPRERRDLLEATEESFDELIATNLKGPHFLTQAAARWMAGQRHGRIVFITSISSYAASVNRGEYCIAKAGLSMSAALYAQRLAPHGVLVYEIRPGIIRTDMTAPVAKDYEERIERGLVPQKRMGEPADVARVVRAIADGFLDYATGQVLDIDGGFHLRSL